MFEKIIHNTDCSLVPELFLKARFKSHFVQRCCSSKGSFEVVPSQNALFVATPRTTAVRAGHRRPSSSTLSSPYCRKTARPWSLQSESENHSHLIERILWRFVHLLYSFYWDGNLDFSSKRDNKTILLSVSCSKTRENIKKVK